MEVKREKREEKEREKGEKRKESEEGQKYTLTPSLPGAVAKNSRSTE